MGRIQLDKSEREKSVLIFEILPAPMLHDLGGSRKKDSVALTSNHIQISILRCSLQQNLLQSNTGNGSNTSNQQQYDSNASLLNSIKDSRIQIGRCLFS